MLLNLEVNLHSLQDGRVDIFGGHSLFSQKRPCILPTKPPILGVWRLSSLIDCVFQSGTDLLATKKGAVHGGQA